MQTFASTCGVVFIAGCQAFAAALTFEDVSPRLPTNTPIVWEAATNYLPSALPIYRSAPQIFSAVTISNAIILAAFPFPKSIIASTNSLSLRDREGDRWSRALNVQPLWGQIDYRDRTELKSTTDVPDEEAVSRRALEYAARLGISTSELFEKPESRRTENFRFGEAKNQVCARSTVLTRKIDGFELKEFGFEIQLGSQGQIRRFALLWPELKPIETQRLVNVEQIIECIRAQKTPMAVTADGSMDWAKLKSLATAHSLTVTNITPVYAEGEFGGTSEENDPDRYFTPYAELDCIAELGDTNINVRLLSPILATDAAKLLK